MKRVDSERLNVPDRVRRLINQINWHGLRYFQLGPTTFVMCYSSIDDDELQTCGCSRLIFDITFRESIRGCC